MASSAAATAASESLTTLEVADTNEDRDMTEADLKTKAMFW